MCYSLLNGREAHPRPSKVRVFVLSCLPNPVSCLRVVNRIRRPRDGTQIQKQTEIEMEMKIEMETGAPGVCAACAIVRPLVGRHWPQLLLLPCGWRACRDGWINMDKFSTLGLPQKCQKSDDEVEADTAKVKVKVSLSYLASAAALPHFKYINILTFGKVWPAPRI